MLGLAVALAAFFVGAGAPPPPVTDPLPSLSVSDVATIETNVDTDAVLTVALSAASDATVTVRYATADGTADATDFVPDSGTLTFPPGTTTVGVPVLIKGDALDEPDETFYVELSNAEHATIARARGTVTIVDSDSPRVFPVEATVRASWNVHRTYTGVRWLRVAAAPPGARIEAHCRGKGCPFAARETGREATPLFRTAKLRPGATVQLWVDAPGTIGKAFVYTIRSGKQPRATTLCLPPPATKPAPC